MRLMDIFFLFRQSVGFVLEGSVAQSLGQNQQLFKCTVEALFFLERLSGEGLLILYYQMHQSHRSIASAQEEEKMKNRAFCHCNHKVNYSPEGCTSPRETERGQRI